MLDGLVEDINIILFQDVSKVATINLEELELIFQAENLKFYLFTCFIPGWCYALPWDDSHRTSFFELLLETPGMAIREVKLFTHLFKGNQPFLTSLRIIIFSPAFFEIILNFFDQIFSLREL